MLGLFVLVRKVRDVWAWLNCMHVDASEGGAVMSRCGFRSVRYLEVKIRCKNALGPRIVSAVRSLEVVASRRLPMVLQVWDFQSVTRTLSALGSVSASRSVRSERFYCIAMRTCSKPVWHTVTHCVVSNQNWMVK